MELFADQEGGIRQVPPALPQLRAMGGREGVSDAKATEKRNMQKKEGKMAALPQVKEEAPCLRVVEGIHRTEDAANRMLIEVEAPGTRRSVDSLRVTANDLSEVDFDQAKFSICMLERESGGREPVRWKRQRSAPWLDIGSIVGIRLRNKIGYIMFVCIMAWNMVWATQNDIRQGIG